MEINNEVLFVVKNEVDAQAVYREIKRTCDFVGFARRFKATLESMEPEFFKPAVNCVRNRIMKKG